MSNEEDEVMTEAKEMMDITEMLELAASCLSVTDPILCVKENFNLQDSMAALELMDQKMDCCEVPASHVAPFGREVDTQVEKKVFPRPAPVGLNDVVDPLPWENLTMQDAAFISLESLIRLESLLSGASVVERHGRFLVAAFSFFLPVPTLRAKPSYYERKISSSSIYCDLLAWDVDYVGGTRTIPRSRTPKACVNAGRQPKLTKSSTNV